MLLPNWISPSVWDPSAWNGPPTGKVGLLEDLPQLNLETPSQSCLGFVSYVILDPVTLAVNINHHGARERVQMFKCLPCKHEDLSSILSSHIKSKTNGQGG